jgi:hypothetical protein
VNFLTGGLPYATRIGKASNFEMKADHGPISEEVLKLFRRLHGKKGVTTPDPEAYEERTKMPSLIEYVSPAIDELKPGSNADFKAATDAVVKHVEQIFGLKPEKGISRVPGSPQMWMGWPIQELRTWLDVEQYDQLETAIFETAGKLNRNLGIQVTAGFIPSALPKLYGDEATRANKDFKQETDPGRLGYALLTKEIEEGVKALFDDPKFDEDDAFEKRPTPEKEALRGLLLLAYSYVVGEAWYRAGAEIGVGKNMVPFLLQMKWDTLRKKAMPKGFVKIPPTLVASIARVLGKRPAARTEWWQEHKELRLVKPEEARTGFMRELDAETFIADLLSDRPTVEIGNKNLAGDAQRKPMREVSDEKLGMPLERRYVEIFPSVDKRHTSANLHEVVMGFVKEARELNTRHLSSEAKAKAIAAAESPAPACCSFWSCFPCSAPPADDRKASPQAQRGVEVKEEKLAP